MMKPTMQAAIMMVVIAVALVQSQNTAQIANVLVDLLEMEYQVRQQEMVIAMMETTKQTAIMMVETVVALVSMQISALNVNVLAE